MGIINQTLTSWIHLADNLRPAAVYLCYPPEASGSSAETSGLQQFSITEKKMSSSSHRGRAYCSMIVETIPYFQNIQGWTALFRLKQ